MQNNVEGQKDRMVLGLKENRLLFSAALGISLVALPTLVQASPGLSSALGVSLLCFAFSIPLTAMCAYLTTLGIDYEANLYGVAFAPVATLGLLAVFVGITGMFSHVHWAAGALFGGVSLVAFALAMFDRLKYKNLH